jgi:hypothetical protein
MDAIGLGVGEKWRRWVKGYPTTQVFEINCKQSDADQF